MEALMQATSSRPTEAALPAKREERLHRLMLAVVLYWACAIYIDAYHHAHDGFRIESFFIWEHLPLYAGWLAACALLAIYYRQSARLGLSHAQRLPSAYWLVAVGAIGYGLAGGLDMLWHSAFGFEQNLSVTWSPSHLALKTADFFVLAGLLRYSLAHRGPDDTMSLRAALPLLIPMAIVLWYAMWTTWYTNPLTADWASGGALVSHLDAFDYLEYGSGAGMVAGTLGMLWNVVLLVPFLVVPLARWSLPVGSITIMVALYAVIMTAAVDTLIFLPAVIGGAILGDVLWAWIRRVGRTGQPAAYAVLGAVVALAQGIGYFATVASLPSGIVWPVHLWAGVLVMSAAVGGWLGYLAAGRPAPLPFVEVSPRAQEAR
jgi:hypothetical protein